MKKVLLVAALVMLSACGMHPYGHHGHHGGGACCGECMCEKGKECKDCPCGKEGGCASGQCGGPAM